MTQKGPDSRIRLVLNWVVPRISRSGRAYRLVGNASLQTRHVGPPTRVIDYTCDVKLFVPVSECGSRLAYDTESRVLSL
jgi:hypothetical protein